MVFDKHILSNKHNIDIIIPIYNAYEDLVVCLDSLYKYTDLDNNRLILINDNSPDKRIKELLERQKGKNIIVKNNESNCGFSANINAGMGMSVKNDVILLNSDTILTKNWVEKMVACAYRDAAIGTVTPLSNNATLCSVPNMFEENQLDEDFTVDEAAAIVERVSLHRYPRISVAVGFCMFVKREVIDTIGMFDAETFGRGYGEENDFCNRAEQAGYMHVMCDDTYIYHTGTKSFMNAEKLALYQAHDKILRERYPAQMHANDVYVRDNPNSDIGANVKVHFALNNGRKNILYVVQSDFREDAKDHVGGTQFHVKQLTKALKGKCNIFVAAVNGRKINLTIYIDSEVFSYQYAYEKSSVFYMFHNEMLAEMWRKIIKGFQIDYVHVHHVLNMSLDIFYVAKEYDIPLFCTVHDFFFVCPSEKLLDYKNEVCACAEQSCEKCKECLWKNKEITDKVDYIKSWRRECAAALNLCDEIFVPDDSAKEILTFYYPTIGVRIKTKPHGYDLVKGELSTVKSNEKKAEYYIEEAVKNRNGWNLRGWARGVGVGCEGGKIRLEVLSKLGKKMMISTSQNYRPDADESFDAGFSAFIPFSMLNAGNTEVTVLIERKGECLYADEKYIVSADEKELSNKKLNIAFIGGINDAKGGRLISDIIKRSTNDVNWYVFGGIGCSELNSLERDNLVKTGWYNQNDIANIIAMYGIDIIGILSIWPETYSYTMTESILCGVPVIVNDIGALGRRIDENNCGWKISISGGAKEFNNIINQVTKNPSCIDVKKKNIQNCKILSEQEMAEGYLKEYLRYAAKDITESSEDDHQYLMSGYIGKQVSQNNDCETGISLYDYERVIDENHRIKNSVAYRFSRKLIELRIPGKYFFYSLIKKMLK